MQEKIFKDMEQLECELFIRLLIIRLINVIFNGGCEHEK